MHTAVYWIDDEYPGRLGVMARPRGGDWLDEELRALHHAGVDVLVSLLTPAEQFALDLTDEADVCVTHQMSFSTWPIPDRRVPSLTVETVAFVRDLVHQREQGRHVVLHCRMGIGRSALEAACILVMLGMTVNAALHRIEQARGCPVPDTPEQRTWVEQFAQRYANFVTELE